MRPVVPLTVQGRRVLGAILLLGPVSTLPAPASGQASRAAFVSWARNTASPVVVTDTGAIFPAPAALERIVGRARIVGVGESIHGIREFLHVRYGITRFLIERMGFTAVALESGLPDAKAVHDYVMGIIDQPTGFWTRGFTWGMGAQAETRDFIEWLRAYNRDPSHRRKVRFYGMDVAGANGGWSEAAEQVFAFLDRVEPAFASSARQRLSPLLIKFARPGFTETNDAFAALPEADRNAIVALTSEVASRFDLLRVSYLASSTAEDYDWARQIAANLRAAAAMVVNYEARNRPNPVWNGRDLAMAENVRWIRQREGPDGGVVVLAHNAHVQTTMSTEVAANMSSLGVFLRSQGPDDYRTIGLAFGRGAMAGGGDGVEAVRLPPADSTTLDGTLAEVGRPSFLLDLGRLPAGSAARQWLDQPVRQRIQAMATTYYQLRGWNALIFVDSISPARPGR